MPSTKPNYYETKGWELPDWWSMPWAGQPYTVYDSEGGNGVWDSNEFFYDLNGNNTWDEGEEFWDVGDPIYEFGGGEEGIDWAWIENPSTGDPMIAPLDDNGDPDMYGAMLMYFDTQSWQTEGTGLTSEGMQNFNQWWNAYQDFPLGIGVGEVSLDPVEDPDDDIVVDPINYGQLISDVQDAWQEWNIEQSQGVGFDPILGGGDPETGADPQFPGGVDPGSVGAMPHAGQMVWDDDAGTWVYESNLPEGYGGLEGASYEEWLAWLEQAFPNIQDMEGLAQQLADDFNLTPIDWLSDQGYLDDISTWLGTFPDVEIPNIVGPDDIISDPWERPPYLGLGDVSDIGDAPIEPEPRDPLPLGYEWSYVDGEWLPTEIYGEGFTDWYTDEYLDWEGSDLDLNNDGTVDEQDLTLATDSGYSEDFINDLNDYIISGPEDFEGNIWEDEWFTDESNWDFNNDGSFDEKDIGAAENLGIPSEIIGSMQDYWAGLQGPAEEGQIEIPEYPQEPAPGYEKEFDMWGVFDPLYNWPDEGSWADAFWESVDAGTSGGGLTTGPSGYQSGSVFEGELGPIPEYGYEFAFHIDPDTGEYVWDEDYESWLDASGVQGTLQDWIDWLLDMFPNYSEEALSDAAQYMYDYYQQAGIHLSPYWLDEQGFSPPLIPEEPPEIPDMPEDEIPAGFEWVWNPDSGIWDLIESGLTAEEIEVLYEEGPPGQMLQEGYEWVFDWDAGQWDQEYVWEDVEYQEPEEGMPLEEEWVEGPYGGYKADPDAEIPIEGEEEGWFFIYNPETEEWDETWMGEDEWTPDSEFDIPDEAWETAPWFAQQYGWEGWNELPYEMQEFLYSTFGNPEDWEWYEQWMEWMYGGSDELDLTIENPAYQEALDEYERYSENWSQGGMPGSPWNTDELLDFDEWYASPLSGYGEFAETEWGLPDITDWIPDEPLDEYIQVPGENLSDWGGSGGPGIYDIINPYDTQSIINAMAGQTGEGFTNWLEGEGLSLTNWFEEDPDAGLHYLQSLGGWDPSMVGTFTPEMMERAELGYYDPVMEASRASALGGAMQQYGGGIGSVLDPAAYEELLRGQIASGTLQGYEGIQGQQQQAYGEMQGIMDEWAQLISAFGLGGS